MIEVGMINRILAYVAAGVSVISVILAAVSRFAGVNLAITDESYMSLATLAIIFAIFFLIEGAAANR